MKPYQERVVVEKAELDKKIEALDAFLKAEESPQIVSGAEWERMQRQLACMSSYSGVLGERIENFK